MSSSLFEPARHGETLYCCGVRVDLSDAASAAETLLACAEHGTGAAVHFVNAYTLSIALSDAAFRAVLNESTWNFPDGMPLVAVGRLKGSRVVARAYGPTVMRRCLEEGAARDTKHYLYGSTDEVLVRLTDHIARQYPDAKVAGSEAPPFRALDDSELDAAVNRIIESGAEIVWVGLGTPAQDWFVGRVASRAPDIVWVPVGAAFDFLAGTKRQAPDWVGSIGMEWLFRLLSEPRRLWRRYFIGNLRFILGLFRHRTVMVRGEE